MRSILRSPPKRLRAIVAITFCVLSIGAWAEEGKARTESAPWRVLVLNSGDVMIPFWLTIDPVMRESIVRGAAPRTVDFLGEALDLVRFPNLESDQVALLRNKYTGLRIDLVIAMGLPALQFAMKHRDAIWRGAPIVFLAVPAGAVREDPRQPNVTGVFYEFDVHGTLDLIKRLQPDWRRLVVAGGNSPFDLALNALLLRHGEHAPNGVAVEYVNDRTREELTAILAALPAHSAVLYTSMSRDASGATHTPQDMAGWVARAASAPVYAIFPTMIGQGIVGGSMVSIEDEIAAAARLALRVLRAGTAEGIPMQPSPPPRCLLDFRALQRWNISESAVPDSCEVRFVPRGIWREYPLQSAAATVTIAMLAALVLALVLEHRRRSKADLAVQQLRNTLFHASRLAAVGELTASIAHEINQPLGAMLTNADTARMIIDRDPKRVADVSRILADIRSDNMRASAVIRRIRGFVAGRPVERQRNDVNDLVSEVLALLRHEVAQRKITASVSLDPGLPEVLGDRVQLQQVLLNLLLNATDAMTETPEANRLIAVRTSTLEDGSVEIAVEDHGHGIAEENFAHLFDSFWSTKPDGMGLGLAIVKSIVEAHGGSIQASRNEFGGATFYVRLPEAPASAPAAVADVPKRSMA